MNVKARRRWRFESRDNPGCARGGPRSRRRPSTPAAVAFGDAGPPPLPPVHPPPLSEKGGALVSVLLAGSHHGITPRGGARVRGLLLRGRRGALPQGEW